MRERWIAEFEDLHEISTHVGTYYPGRFHVMVYKSGAAVRPWRARIIGTDEILVVMSATAEDAKQRANSLFSRQLSEWQKVEVLCATAGK